MHEVARIDGQVQRVLRRGGLLGVAAGLGRS
jgi:hypothetical protein